MLKIWSLHQQLFGTKILTLALTTSLFIVGTSIDNILLILDQILYIYYLFYFQKDNIKVKVLINSGSKVNRITSAYGLKLSLNTRHTNVGTQKIDSFTFKILAIILASFWIEHKLGQAWYFQETFLLADTSIKILLGIFFISLSNIDIKFAKKEFIWRFYIISKTLSTTKQVEFINK